MSDMMHDFTHNQLAATLPDTPATAVLDKLAELGDDVSVEVVHGESGISHLDVDGSEHGFLASLKRTLQEEQGPISMLVDAMEGGAHVVFVHHVSDETVDDAVAELSQAGSGLMFHFGEYNWRRLGG